MFIRFNVLYKNLCYKYCEADANKSRVRNEAPDNPPETRRDDRDGQFPRPPFPPLSLQFIFVSFPIDGRLNYPREGFGVTAHAMDYAPHVSHGEFGNEMSSLSGLAICVSEMKSRIFADPPPPLISARNFGLSAMRPSVNAHTPEF